MNAKSYFLSVSFSDVDRYRIDRFLAKKRMPLEEFDIRIEVSGEYVKVTVRRSEAYSIVECFSRSGWRNVVVSAFIKAVRKMKI